MRRPRILDCAMRVIPAATQIGGRLSRMVITYLHAARLSETSRFSTRRVPSTSAQCCCFALPSSAIRVSVAGRELWQFMCGGSYGLYKATIPLRAAPREPGRRKLQGLLLWSADRSDESVEATFRGMDFD